MSVIFLFIDGVGLGKENPSNPFCRDDYSAFEAMSGGQKFTKKTNPIIQPGHTFLHVDACLGVEGLPQSGTGQTALFTGQNAAKEIGKHFGPFPHSGIKKFLRKESVFQKVQKMDKTCTFVNAYPDVFFQKAEQRNRWSCTTLMTKSAGIHLNTTEDVKNKKAVTAGLTQQAWRTHLHLDVPEITPEAAASRLIEQATRYDLLLHEYYLTDKAGHSKNNDTAADYLGRYNRFLSYLLDNSDGETTIVLSSDHGNIEDLSVKTHTLNKVPLFAYGPGAGYFTKAKSIMDITAAILKVLG